MIQPKKHLNDISRMSNQAPSRLTKHRLDRNERNQSFSQDFVKRIQNKINDELFMTYPEPGPFYKKMARRLNVPQENLMVHLGSEQSIKNVFESFINPGDRVLVHLPCFAMYPVYCSLFQAELIALKYNSEIFLDWEKYIHKIESDLRMVVVENPNGFLGVAVPLKLIYKIVKKAHEKSAIAVVDEAYYHFHNESVVDWIKEFDNLIIVRTLSKAFGLAGLRIGYIISQPENIVNLMKFRPAYEITALSMLVADDLLDNVAEMEHYVNDTKENIRNFRKGFKDLGIETSDSRANFLVARIGPRSVHDALRESLDKKEILIRRPFSEPELKEWVRISTAPPDIQQILLDELKRIIKTG